MYSVEANNQANVASKTTEDARPNECLDNQGPNFFKVEQPKESAEKTVMASHENNLRNVNVEMLSSVCDSLPDSSYEVIHSFQ